MSAFPEELRTAIDGCLFALDRLEADATSLLALATLRNQLGIVARGGLDPHRTSDQLGEISERLFSMNGVVRIELPLMEAVARAQDEARRWLRSIERDIELATTAHTGEVLFEPSERAVARPIARPPTRDVTALFEEEDPAPPAGEAVEGERVLRAPPKIVCGSVEAFHDQVIDGAITAIAAAARRRSARPWAERRDHERAIATFLDAIAVVGERSVAGVVRSFRRRLQSRDPYAPHAVAMALGSLDGGDSLQALTECLKRVPVDAWTAVGGAGVGLGLAPHPSKSELVARLAHEPHPVLRAVALEARRVAGEASVEDVAAGLVDAHPLVLRSALRAAATLGAKNASRLVPLVGRHVALPVAELSFLAARTLLSWGITWPVSALRSDDWVVRRLELHHVLELIVLAGDASDLEWLAPRMERTLPTKDHLDALARIGDPRVWGFLVQALADEELADPAASALETLFGFCVDAERRLDPMAWREAVQRLDVPAGTRLRGGAPWSADVVRAEILSGRLAMPAVERRLDELRSRFEVFGRVRPDAWSADADAELDLYLEALSRNPAARALP